MSVILHAIVVVNKKNENINLLTYYYNLRITKTNITNMSHLPCYIPGVGNLPSRMGIIPDDAPVYSDYTGNLIGYGPVPWGTMSDAPVGHKMHDKIFHGVILNGVGEYRVHSPNPGWH